MCKDDESIMNTFVLLLVIVILLEKAQIPKSESFYTVLHVLPKILCGVSRGLLLVNESYTSRHKCMKPDCLKSVL